MSALTRNSQDRVPKTSFKSDITISRSLPPANSPSPSAPLDREREYTRMINSVSNLLLHQSNPLFEPSLVQQHRLINLAIWTCDHFSVVSLFPATSQLGAVYHHGRVIQIHIINIHSSVFDPDSFCLQFLSSVFLPLTKRGEESCPSSFSLQYRC